MRRDHAIINLLLIAAFCTQLAWSRTMTSLIQSSGSSPTSKSAACPDGVGPVIAEAAMAESLANQEWSVQAHRES